MTYQVQNYVLYDGQVYVIVGEKDLDWHDLPSPETFGMEPYPNSTAIHSGFFNLYEIVDNWFFLKNMYLRTKNDEYLPINGILPVEQSPEKIMAQYVYENLNLPVNVSCSLMLGQSYVGDGCFPMEMCYRRLIEAKFETGKAALTDLTSRLAEMRSIILVESAKLDFKRDESFDIYRLKCSEIYAQYGIFTGYRMYWIHPIYSSGFDGIL